jgi:hypothetical protein
VGYLVVLMVAAAVAVAVYAITLRDGAQPIPGFGDADRPPDTAYVSVTGGKPDWQSRLTGLLGLVVAVVIGGAALAAILWFAIQAIGRLVGGISGDGATP